MNKAQIIAQIFKKQSFLCVGLDTDPDKIAHLGLGKGAEAVLAFNKKIIEATADFAVAYKINTAFYEAMGSQGWEAMEQTARLLPPDTLRIADAKRGDIGNTAAQYAKAFFERNDFDAITLAPYMGRDSVSPFLDYSGKWSILLALTSNQSASDLQMLEVDNHGEVQFLYQQLVEQATVWGSDEQLMFVVGATRPQGLAEVRRLAPRHFLLVPGLGAQGGSLEMVAQAGLNAEVGLLVNASRNIIYAGTKAENFESQAAREAKKIAMQMRQIIEQMKN